MHGELRSAPDRAAERGRAFDSADSGPYTRDTEL